MDARRIRAALRRLPWGLLGMVALVYGIEATLERHALDFSDMTNVSWRVTGREAVRQARGREVLFFGDSMTKMGIVPEVIERVSGKTAYNLAVNAAAPPASYFLLRRVLESGARPSAVFFEVAPTCLGLPPQARPTFLNWWSELLSFRESLELDWTVGDPEHFAGLTMARTFASVRYREPIRTDIMAAFRGDPVPPRPSVLPIVRNVYRNRGAMILRGHENPPTRIDIDAPVMHTAFFPDGWSPDKTNLVYIRRFLTLADEYKIPVYWVLPPLTPQIQAKRDELGHEAFVTRLVSAMQRRHPGLTVIDGRRSGYPVRRFWDLMNHLDGPGATVFSSDLAAVLKAGAPAPASPRWIHLPAFREPPPGAPLEDTVRSALVLKAKADRALRVRDGVVRR